MASLVMLTTTVEGFNKLKELVNEKLSADTSYNDGSILDRADSVEESYGCVVLNWKWVKWRDYFADIMAVELSLIELGELSIPYKIYKIHEGYSEDLIDQDCFDDEDVLPEISTKLELTYDFYS